jgi:hypothetical protein
MAGTTLNTTSGSGTQATTQSPQSAGAATATTNSNAVQPGTASDLLRSNNGVELKSTPLTTVSLGAKSSTSTAQPPVTNQHHINPVLGVFSVALFILAIVLFWLTSRSAKNTT